MLFCPSLNYGLNYYLLIETIFSYFKKIVQLKIMARKSKQPMKLLQKHITNRDKFGADVKWNINGEDTVKTCPGGCCSLCFMLIFWLMTITAVLEYNMKQNWTLFT